MGELAAFLGLRPLVFLVLLLAVSYTRAVTEKKTFSIFDSWDGQSEFRKRGQVTLAVDEADDLQVSVDNQAAPPPSKDVNGFYQLKLVDDSNPDQYAMTSVSACQLRRANYRDEIIVTLGPSGSILSVTYDPLVSPLAPTCRELEEDSTSWPIRDSFESKISYETSTPGMTLPVVLPNSKPPGGMKFFPRSNKDATFDPDMEQEAPKSFFQRYWYIIAAFIVMQFLQSGAAGEEGQQQQQGQQSDGAPQAVGAGTAAASRPAAGGGATSPSASGPRRRGKRG